MAEVDECASGKWLGRLCYTAMAFVVDDNDDKIFEMFSICLSPKEL